MSDLLDRVYRDYLAIRRQGHKPGEIRLGAMELRELKITATNLVTGPFSLDFASGVFRLFGVPVRRINMEHYVDVLPEPEP